MTTVELTHQKLTKKARGVRLRPRHQEEIRAKIQASQILNMLQEHILTGSEIAASRIHAGLKLLDKVLPNAIPESIESNNQAQALLAINQAQLMAMAQETLRIQGDTVNTPLGNTYDNESVIDSIQDKDRDNLPVN